MAAGTLFTYPDNFKAFKALIAAEYSGAKVQVSFLVRDLISSVASLEPLKHAFSFATFQDQNRFFLAKKTISIDSFT